MTHHPHSRVLVTFVAGCMLHLCLSARASDGEDLLALRANAQSMQNDLQRLEATRGRYHPDLLDPLMRLAQAHEQAGRPDDAIRSLEQALAVARREGGLKSPDQIPILTTLAELEARSGSIAEAQQRVRLFGTIAHEDRPEQWMQMASLQVEFGEFDSARKLYRRAIDHLKNTSGATEQQLLTALRGLGTSYTRQLLTYGVVAGTKDIYAFHGPVASDTKFSAGPAFRLRVARELRQEGENALKSAARRVQRATQMSVVQRAATLIQVGDWFQIKSDADEAHVYYRAAAQLLARSQLRPDTPDLILDAPVPVLMPLPAAVLRYRDIPDTRTEELHVLVEFDVDAKGEPRRPEVIDATGTHSMKEATLASIHNTRYRPRLIDGKPVLTRAVQHRQVFRVPVQHD